MSKNIEQQLAQVRAFMETEAYSSFIANYKDEVATIEAQMVQITPDSQDEIVALSKLHRARLAAIDIQTFFPTFVTTLEGELEALTTTPESNEE